MKACTFPGCNRAVRCHGLCPGHDKQRERGKELTPIAARRVICSVTWCNRKHWAKGYCSPHYSAVVNRGEQPRPIGRSRPTYMRWAGRAEETMRQLLVNHTCEEAAKEMGVPLRRFVAAMCRLGITTRKVRAAAAEVAPKPVPVVAPPSRLQEPRCRCGLRLPCNGCIPTARDYAAARRAA